VRTRLQWLSWTLLVAYVLWIAGLRVLAARLVPVQAVSFAEQLLLVVFFVGHALGYYLGTEVLFFAIANAIVSNVFENLSILYGFPFGYYHHTIGPRLFNVPCLVTLIYMGLGYISWMVAQVLLRRTGYRSWRRRVADCCVRFHVLGPVYRPDLWNDLPGICL